MMGIGRRYLILARAYIYQPCAITITVVTHLNSATCQWNLQGLRSRGCNIHTSHHSALSVHASTSMLDLVDHLLTGLEKDPKLVKASCPWGHRYRVYCTVPKTPEAPQRRTEQRKLYVKTFYRENVKAERLLVNSLLVTFLRLKYNVKTQGQDRNAHAKLRNRSSSQHGVILILST